MNIIPKHDYYKTKLDGWTITFWIILFILITWSVTKEVRDMRRDERIYNIEIFQGPQAETPYKIIRGKVCLVQSPYVMQVTP